ncbi:MAG: beta-galactosidase [Candidatus Brocadiia bacterium]
MSKLPSTGLLAALLAAAWPARAAAGRQPLEYAFTIWDWTRDYRDLGRFRARVDELRAMGFNTVELSVAWKDVQPEASDRFRWDATDARVDAVLGEGLRLRVRINFAYAHPWPKWVEPQLATRFDGKRPAKLMTIFDENLNALEDAAAQAIAAHYRGRGIEWCPVFGVHTEAKLSSWLSYEPAAREAFRAWLRWRYGTLAALSEAWGRDFEAWQAVQPPVLGHTDREPDLRAAACDWMAFREEAIARRLAQLLAAVRRGDPAASTSVVLGESFRRGSAQMANLGYRAYSRHADRVVFAYDFNWHGPQGRDEAALSLAIMRGVSGKPTVFEFGGPAMVERNGYTDADMVFIGRLALDEGAAGLNMCNYCYTDEPLAAFPHLEVLARDVAARNARPPSPAPKATSLYYVSKWANYLFRHPRSEWLHERQFAPYRRLRARGLRPRIVSDANLLEEPLGGYTRLYVAPPLVVEARAAARLRELADTMATVPPDPLAEATILEQQGTTTRRAPR